jgi:5-methyltetrahydrofolate--homocysteine methyltransferase
MASLERLKNMIIAGDEEAPEATQALVDDGLGAQEILDEALLPGMDVVGEQMKTGEMFIPEVLLSARTMQACLDIVRPLMSQEGTSRLGKVVIGTVEGDVHDIGKNLVAMLLSGTGFEVVNIGKGITAEQFVDAVKQHQPDIVGMSALLTTTTPKMPQVIEALKQAGLRDGVKVMVGGAPVNQSWADEIGADAYGADASLAVGKAKELMSTRV